MTYTVLAIDAEAGLIGAATASYSLAVGNAVIAVAPDVGAVASQAYTNRRLRSHAIDGLRDGLTPQAIIARLPEWDGEPQLRQLSVISRDGTTAAATGSGCSSWAGEWCETGIVVTGNLLAGPQVLSAMRTGFAADRLQETEPVHRFAARLLSALHAGESAGGDVRGRQSAAIQVAPMTTLTSWPPDCAVDLRADNSTDPVHDLTEALRLQFG
ncbi:putative Ntn-hydrolase superfamily protein [Stackebrandtia endophytica]|uniref:Putative Ntn-hydrolase superfamily protein n=1 Tax=Stackebrandtia endophytica TaxID=1496996 RepID=A0A543B1B4_9ACTN|nr:DUF1028 domain-containing protein [Stackebrandtia endophytica]TQL78627.1 putative Ntn-hydrolase superfamily protein [Stackebrandtia endophytica]